MEFLAIMLKTNLMASLEMSGNSKAANGRTKKPVPRVDLTAMVDLAFLLITFFMLTTSLSKMNAMDLAKPVDSEPEDFHAYPASRSMTVLLGKNNKVIYYFGEAKNAKMEVADMKDIGRQLLAGKAKIAATHSTPMDKVMLMIIKPTNGSNYRNFVDIIDEMNINAIATYAVDDDLILPQEKQFLETKRL